MVKQLLKVDVTHAKIALRKSVALPLLQTPPQLAQQLPQGAWLK
jgi:hypothetical protein